VFETPNIRPDRPRHNAFCSKQVEELTNFKDDTEAKIQSVTSATLIQIKGKQASDGMYMLDDLALTDAFPYKAQP
jgi:hypothetical protein